MRAIKRFIMMLQFFTTIPIKQNIKCSAKEYGKALTFAPLIGMIIGTLLMGVYYGLEPFFPSKVIFILILIAYIIFTGGIHLDGLADTFDGLFSGKPKEKILDIMRDSRVGTNGILAIICLLLLNYTLLMSLELQNIEVVLILFPVAGRMASLIGAGASRYARKTRGLGKSFIDFCGLKEIMIGIIFYAVIFYIALRVEGLIIAAITIVFPYLILKLITRKIQGATGDVLGALCEINQTCFLICIIFFSGTNFITI